MNFGGDIGKWQRSVAESKAGTSRRLAVIEALNIQKGQAFLDVGCGGGHLVKDLGVATGSEGRVVGLDNSSAQLTNARALCDALASIEFIEGSATEIPADDGQFDGIAAIQTYEYIQDINGALTEARRVLKHGAPAAIVSILWEHCKFYGAEKQLNDRVTEAFEAHCFHQMLPLELPRLLDAAAFGIIARTNLSYVDTTMHAGNAAFYLSKLMAAFAITQGVSEEDSHLWLSQLDAADKKQTFGFVNFF